MLGLWHYLFSSCYPKLSAGTYPLFSICISLIKLTKLRIQLSLFNIFDGRSREVIVDEQKDEKEVEMKTDVEALAPQLGSDINGNLIINIINILLIFSTLS